MHGLTKQLARCLTAGAPVLGLLLAYGPAASASAAQVTHHPRFRYSAQAMASARSELQRLLVGQHDNAQWYDDNGPGHSHAKAAGPAQVQSTNWAGYADTGSGFTQVTAKWVEPTGKCSSQTSLAAFWVGIDGFSSTSVEQDGTLIECQGGQPFYFTWWEMFPANSVQIVSQQLQPGDSIKASVTRNGTSYTLSVTDSTHTANSFSTTQTCSDCDNSSAEWIAEAPTGSAGIEPLSQFGTWTTSNDFASTGSAAKAVSAFSDNEITLVDSSGNVQAVPVALNPAGNWFRVYWKAST
jgi:hypothetical protein